MIDENPYAPPLTPPETPEFSAWDKLHGCAFVVYLLFNVAFLASVAPSCMVCLMFNVVRVSPWLIDYDLSTKKRDFAFFYVLVLSIIEGSPFLPYYWSMMAKVFNYVGGLL